VTTSPPDTRGEVGAEPAEPPPSRRTGLIVAGATAVAILVLAVVLGPKIVDQATDANIAPAPKGPNLASVDLREDIPNSEVSADIDYPEVPPDGGDHAKEWLSCGLYTKAVREENAVHSLERGAVWVTYNPDQISRKQARAMFEKLPEDKGIVSPYVGLPGNVVLSVWGAQLQLLSPDDPRFDLFLEEYGDGHLAPEPDAGCADGVEEFEKKSGGAPE
jgi:hypothetical protein